MTNEEINLERNNTRKNGVTPISRRPASHPYYTHQFKKFHQSLLRNQPYPVRNQNPQGGSKPTKHEKIERERKAEKPLRIANKHHPPSLRKSCTFFITCDDPKSQSSPLWCLSLPSLSVSILDF